MCPLVAPCYLSIPPFPNHYKSIFIIYIKKSHKQSPETLIHGFSVLFKEFFDFHGIEYLQLDKNSKDKIYKYILSEIENPLE